MFFIVKINWFVDGIFALSEKNHHTIGNDIVIFGGAEDEILLFAEDLIETWGQGGRFSHYLVNYTDKKIDTLSNMEGCYWGFDNVENFGLIDYEILDKYSFDEVQNKKVKDGFIYEAIINKNFYQI